MVLETLRITECVLRCSVGDYSCPRNWERAETLRITECVLRCSVGDYSCPRNWERAERARRLGFWELVAKGGIEPPTQGFSVLCSTD